MRQLWNLATQLCDRYWRLSPIVFPVDHPVTPGGTVSVLSKIRCVKLKLGAGNFRETGLLCPRFLLEWQHAIMDEDIQPWLRFAESDMVSAETLHRAGQELNTIFHLQQAVEKTLNALLIKRTASFPPRIHDLLKLADLCGISLEEKQVQLLENLNEFYIESRYPEAWGKAPSETSPEKTARLMRSTKEFVEWLRQQL